MTPIDARSLTDSSSSTVRAQVAIVGAGAAGILLGLDLAARGIDTLLLESGGMEAEPPNQELAEVDAPGRALRRDVISHPRRFGGATTVWGGRCIPLTSTDVEPRPWVAHSGWPIGVDAIAPYHDRVATRLAVTNADDGREILGDGVDQLHASVEAHPGLSVELFGWAGVLDFSTSLRSAVEAEPNLRLLHHANVVRIDRQPEADLVERVVVAPHLGAEIAVEARHYVLASGGIENPRLLLASAPADRGGLGDLGGWVGRGVMEHPKAGEVTAGGTIVPSADFPANWFRRNHRAGRSIQYHLGFSERVQRAEERLHHACYIEPKLKAWSTPAYRASGRLRESLSERRVGAGMALDVGRAIAGLPGLVRYSLAERARRELPLETVQLVTQLEQPPDNGSSVVLTSRYDRFGVPLPAFDWRVGEAEHRDARRLHEFVDSWLRGCGFGHLESPLLADPKAELDYVNASHPMGATRMASSMAEGVVDADLTVFTTANLHVVGTSVMPTTGYANPTFTALALALRLGDHLHARLAEPAAVATDHSPTRGNGAS